MKPLRLEDLQDMPLFANAKAHTNDPRTSHDAAERASEFYARHQRMILHVLKRLGGATSDEVAASGLGLTKVQVARRMGELRDRGLVRESGKTRPTPSGRQSVVWEVT